MVKLKVNMVNLWYDRYNGGFVVVTFKRTKQAGSNNELVSFKDTSSETSWRQAGDKLETSSGQVKDLIDALPTGYHGGTYLLTIIEDNSNV